MVTLQTYLLYALLFLIMFFLAKRASDKGEWFWMILAILMYSIVFGMRYGVGVDHISYLKEYEQLAFVSDNPYDDTEIGYRLIRNILVNGGFHFSIYFGLIAFLQLWLIFKSVQKDRFVYPYLVTAFFLGCIWLSYSNGLRQCLAFCIFVYSLLFVENKKQLPIHWLLLLLATTMHNSAWLLFAIAPLLYIRKDWFRNIKTQYVLLVVAIIVGKLPQMEGWLMSFEGNMGILDGFMEETGYNNYFEYEDGEGIARSSAKAAGVGYFVELIKNIMLIWFCNETKKFNANNRIVTYMYNLTYIGILMHYLFITSQLMARVNNYFYGFAYIFGAYTLHYLYKDNKKMFWVLLGLYLLTIIGTLYRMYDNTSAFYFFWQSGLYGK